VRTPLAQPSVMAKVCGRLMCPHKPVGDRWVKAPNASTGGYWEPLCRKHLDEFDSEQEETVGDANDVNVRFQVRNAIEAGDATGINIDGVANEIIASYGLVNVDMIDPDVFWSIVSRHDSRRPEPHDDEDGAGGDQHHHEDR
jgi:hypothetical protein